MVTVESLREELHRHCDVLTGRYAVDRLAVFGSVVRGEATEDSDIDLLVDFSRPVGLLHVIGTQHYLQRLLNVDRVDLVLRRSIIDELRPIILEEAVDVFTTTRMDVPSSAHAGGD